MTSKSDWATTGESQWHPDSSAFALATCHIYVYDVTPLNICVRKGSYTFINGFIYVYTYMSIYVHESIYVSIYVHETGSLRVPVAPRQQRVRTRVLFGRVPD